jgi:hypothetical protein
MVGTHVWTGRWIAIDTVVNADSKSLNYDGKEEGQAGNSKAKAGQDYQHAFEGRVGFRLWYGERHCRREVKWWIEQNNMPGDVLAATRSMWYVLRSYIPFTCEVRSGKYFKPPCTLT